MKASVQVLLLAVACSPILVHCAVEVEPARVVPPPPPPPPPPQVEVAAVAPPPPGDSAPATEYTDDDPSALTDFHDAVDAHGQWVEDSRYGTVWQPAAAEVGPDFVPYTTGGHWAYDDDDYVWVSDYDWGWAPFHYGRWVVGDQGWCWIPGRVYAPAWVTWSTGDPGYAYVGWAPAPPTFYWRGGAYVNVTWAVEPRWGYVASGNLFAPRLGGGVVLRGAAAANIAGRMHPFVTAGGLAAGSHARGPAPTSVGVPPSKITHVLANDPGMAKAKGFANPATAQRFGGRLPSHANPTATTTAGGATGASGSRGNAARSTATQGSEMHNTVMGQTGQPPQGGVQQHLSPTPVASNKPAATSAPPRLPPRTGRRK